MTALFPIKNEAEKGIRGKGGHDIEVVPLGKGGVRSDGDLVLVTGNGNGIPKSTSFATNLNSLLKELAKRSNLHNLIIHWLRTVNYECCPLLLPAFRCCCSAHIYTLSPSLPLSSK